MLSSCPLQISSCNTLGLTHRSFACVPMWTFTPKDSPMNSLSLQSIEESKSVLLWSLLISLSDSSPSDFGSRFWESMQIYRSIQDHMISSGWVGEWEFAYKDGSFNSHMKQRRREVRSYGDGLDGIISSSSIDVKFLFATHIHLDGFLIFFHFSFF